MSLPLASGDCITVLADGDPVRTRITRVDDTLLEVRIELDDITYPRVTYILSDEGTWWIRGWGNEIDAVLRAQAALTETAPAEAFARLTRTTTGRMRSDRPNIANIPRAK